MGASAWSYFVPYQPDFGAALEGLRQKVFDEGDYWWAEENGERPASLDAVFDDEDVLESGTHSILDMFSMVAPGEKPDYGTVELVSPEEAMRYAGVEVLTRDHVDAIDDLAGQRWFGRCAVLHDDAGKPSEIYFWGYSGD